MSIGQNFPFTDSINYTLSNTQVDSGRLKLAIIENPGQIFSESFTSDTGFTYDNTKAEFTGGLVRQIDLRPANSRVAATFTTSKNLNWSQGGSLLGTDIGTPVLSSGKLECIGGGNNAIRYENTEIGSVDGVGTIKLKYTPSYSGMPAGNRNIVEFSPTSGNNDRLLFFHSTTGTLRVTAYNSTGTAIHTAVTMGATPWAPVAGTEYELEFVWDTSTGLFRCFVDGVLNGSSTATVFTRGSAATRLYVGAGTVYAFADAAFNDVVLFSTVQHTSGYTPAYTLPETIYAATSVTLPTFTYTGIGTIQAVEASSFTEAGSPKYIIADKYHNGLAWVSSNGSYSQANTSAEVVANLTSLVVTGAGSFVVKLVFTDSNTLSSTDEVSVTVTGQKYAATGYAEPAQALEVASIISYAQTNAALPAGNNANVILKIDGQLSYHNGSAWVDSDGTLAQSNTPAQINANVATLILGSNSSIYLRWLLTTDSNTETPEVDYVDITYNFGAIEAMPETCEVYGYVKDITGEPVASAVVAFFLVKDSKEYQEANANTVLGVPVSVTTDVNGYFITPLIRTSEYESGGTYKVTITKEGSIASKIGTAKLTFEVPDATTKDITDLLTSLN